MLDLGDQPEMSHRRIGEDLVERVDRADRHVRLTQPPDRVVLPQLRHALLEPRHERVAVHDALAVVRVARIVEELVEVDGAAEALEQRVVPAAHVRVAIRDAERLVRDDRRVRVALGLRHGPVGEVAGGLT
jgi:hypothetical protein